LPREIFLKAVAPAIDQRRGKRLWTIGDCLINPPHETNSSVDGRHQAGVDISGLNPGSARPPGSALALSGARVSKDGRDAVCNARPSIA
jgi:hypothetical protein